MLVRFKELYNKQVIKSLQDEFKYSNKHQVPKLSKVVVNMGVGDAVSDSKVINHAINDLTAIVPMRRFPFFLLILILVLLALMEFYQRNLSKNHMQ